MRSGLINLDVKIKHNSRVLTVFFDFIPLIIVAFILYGLSKTEALNKIKEIIVCFALLCLCKILYLFILDLFGSTLTKAEKQRYGIFLFTAFCIFGLYIIISALLNFNLLFPYYLISGAAFLVTAFLVLCILFRRVKNNRSENQKKLIYVAIIGAGNAGTRLMYELQKKEGASFRVWCFIDDNADIIGSKVDGIKVYGPINAITNILKGSPVNEVIIAIPSLSIGRRQEILDLCANIQCPIKILPDTILFEENEKLEFSAALRSVKLEDLLGRTCVKFKNEEMTAFLTDKVVLVTGGGGSIGSELCRQIATFKPKKLIILDVVENTAYLLKKELDYYSDYSFDILIEIGSIRDEKRLKGLFSKYRPDVVFHAAAHKHVPLMERNPGEAVKNNILATYNLILLSSAFKCSKFVMISTDKAVNPTNVMGATKRYCEMMIQAMADVPGIQTEYVAVRFGNVLGSNGSVVPLFVSQIEHGGPITITDKRIVRYFMTISEAASLVLKAGSLAHKSEIYVLDMGKPVKILSLAENLVKLSGLKPYEDIQIVETGLRAGEKLYEELFISDDINKLTSEPKIYIERQKERSTISEIEKGIKLLNNALETENNELIVSTIKKLVPTFSTPEEINSCVGNELAERESVSCSA